MKNLTKELIVIVVIAVALIGLILAVTNNKETFGFNKEHSTEQVLDSTKVVDIIEAHEAINWTDVSEVQFYLSEQAEIQKIDSMFYSIPYESIINVSTVLLKRYEHIDKRMIVDEYYNNINIYSLLPKHDIQQLQAIRVEKKDSDTITNNNLQ